MSRKMVEARKVGPRRTNFWTRRRDFRDFVKTDAKLSALSRCRQHARGGA